MNPVAWPASIGPYARHYTSRLGRRWGQARAQASASARVPPILAAIAAQAPAAPAHGWDVQRAVWTDTGVAVVFLGPAGESPRAVLKLPRTGDAVAIVRRQIQVLTALHSDLRLGDWCRLLPRPLADGALAGQVYFLEHALPGQPAQMLLAQPLARRQLQLAAATAIGELHRRTATTRRVDAPLLARWIDHPVQRLRTLNSGRALPTANETALDRLATELHRTLAGSWTTVSWVHGDFWPGNVLLSPDRKRVTGIVDWDMAAPEELPIHDLLHLLLYTRRLMERRELGDIIQELLEGTTWTPHEQAVFAAAGVAPPTGEQMRAMVLIYWLRHVAADLVQSADYAHNWLWIRRNIDGVLRRI